MSFRPAACKIAEETGCNSDLGEGRFALFGQQPQLVADSGDALAIAVLPGENGVSVALMLDEGGDGDIAACGADIADRPRERH